MEFFNWFILIFVSSRVGTYTNHIVDTFGLNVWVGRIAGIIACGLTAAFVYWLLFKKKEVEEK